MTHSPDENALTEALAEAVKENNPQLEYPTEEVPQWSDEDLATIAFLEKTITESDDPDELQDLVAQALRFDREDLVAAILEKSIRKHQLLDKLRDFQQPPAFIESISFFDEEELDS